MKAYEFKKVDTLRIDGHQLVVKEYTRGDYFQIGRVKIPAKTKDEAIAKFKEFYQKGARSDDEQLSS